MFEFQPFNPDAENTTEKSQILLEELKGLNQIVGHISLRGENFLTQFMKEIQAISTEDFQHPSLYAHFHYEKEKTKSPLCGKILYKGTKAFKCHQCMLQDNSIICVQCFNSSDHRGHNYEMIEVFGGCCDCGDDEKWEVTGSCVDHRPLTEKVLINQLQGSLFTKEYKFAFYIVLQLYLRTHDNPDRKSYLKCCGRFAKNLALYLKDFNEGSVISNQMTYEMLISPFEDFYPDIQGFVVKGKKLLDLIWTAEKLEQFGRVIVQMYTYMFPIQAFKEDLIISYIEASNRSQTLIMKEFASITCQVYTCHKLVNKLLMEKRLIPIDYKIISSDDFEDIANYHVRLFYDIIYFSRLYNGVNKKYLTFLFTEKTITLMCSYHIRAATINDSISYYGVEKIFLDNLTKVLIVVQDDKNLLKKMMKDCLEEIFVNKFDQNPYISCQRIFSYCLYAYSQGDLANICAEQFLSQIGLFEDFEEKIIFLMKSVLYVCQYYCSCLSNQQAIERFYTFYSFSFNKNPIIMALDFFLLRYSFTLCMKNSIPLQKVFMKFYKNAMIIYQNSAQWEATNDSSRDRKKIVGVFGSFLGLMLEVVCCDWYMLTLGCQLETLKHHTILHQFYGDLLTNFEPIRTSDFKAMLKVYVKEPPPYFEEFINNYTVIQNKKIRLKPFVKEQSAFRAYSFMYLKSKKISKPFNEFLLKNLQSVPFTEVPSTYFPLTPLHNYFFSEQIVRLVCIFANNYIDMLKMNRQIIKYDISHFSLFLENLILINVFVKSIEIRTLFDRIVNFPQVEKMLSQKMRTDIYKVLEVQLNQSSSQNLEEDKKKKKESFQNKLKKKKMELEKKRKAFLSSNQDLIDSTIGDQKNKDASLNQNVCMICKIKNKQPLAYMSFASRSNIFARSFLNSQRGAFAFTSCNHVIHVKCFNNLYGGKDYTICNFCKSIANMLVVTNENENEEEENRVDCLERLKISAAIISGNQQQIHKRVGFEEPKKQEIDLKSELVQAISLSILQGILVDPDFFFKKQLFVYRCFLHSLRQKLLCIEKLKKDIDRDIQQHKQEDNIYWYCHKFLIQTILSVCGGKQQSKDIRWNTEELQSRIPPNLYDTITQMLAFLLSESFDTSEMNFFPLSKIQFTLLPESLNELASEIGRCSHCEMITNEIGKCLICGWKSCIGCKKKNFTYHFLEQHCGSGALIRVDNGEVIYVGGKKVWKNDSIYKNFLGDSYVQGQNKDKYLLCEEQYSQVKKDMLKHRIEQSIRYKEFIKHRYFKLQP